MGTSRKPRSRRRHERGGAVVETALIFPVLLLFLMGIVDFGSVLNKQATIRHKGRSTARDAALNVVSNSGTCTNYLPSGQNQATKAIICQVRQDIGGDPAKVRVKLLFPDGRGQTRRDLVVVCAQQPMESLSGMFASSMSGKVLRSDVTMRIETEPTATKAQSAQEPALTGSDWSWCT